MRSAINSPKNRVTMRVFVQMLLDVNMNVTICVNVELIYGLKHKYIRVLVAHNTY